MGVGGGRGWGVDTSVLHCLLLIESLLVFCSECMHAYLWGCIDGASMVYLHTCRTVFDLAKSKKGVMALEQETNSLNLTVFLGRSPLVCVCALWSICA